MLLDTHRNTSPGIARGRTGAGIAALTVAAVAALLAAPRLSFASAEPGEAALTASASEDVVTTISVTSADETEPKDKPDLHPAPASAPVAVIVAPPPTPPVPPIAAVPPVPGAPIALPAPAPHPAPMPHAITILPGGAGYGGHPTILQAYPTPPVPAAPGDDEFSRRLERLEKLVESLVAPEAKRGPGRAPTKPRGPGPEAPRSEFNSDSRRPSPDKPESARVEVEVRRTEGAPAEAHFQALSRVLEQAARQIESAARQAEVAAKEAEKSSHQRIESLVLADSTRAREQHRKVLDEQRHVLQKQIAEMEAQLGRLEAQFDRVEAQLDREADLAENARDRADVNHQVEKALHDANLARDTEWKERKQLEKELEKAKMKTKAKDDVKEPVDDRATLPPPLPPQR